MTKYTGSKAVVVGGATGVGLAIAKRLAEGGARVLLTGRTPRELADAAAQVGPGACLVLGDPGPEAVADGLGRIDLLFVAEPVGEDALRALLPLLADGGAAVLTGDPAPAAFALELAARGVRVNAVAPGFVDPDVFDPDTYNDLRKRCDDRTPLRRLGTADEVARAALFLAVEATFTTGARLPVDGGLTLRD